MEQEVNNEYELSYGIKRDGDTVVVIYNSPAGKRFERAIHPLIVKWLKQDRLEDRQVATINRYIMQKDSELAYKNYAGYTSTQLRNVKMSEELSKYVKRITEEETAFVDGLKEKGYYLSRYGLKLIVRKEDRCICEYNVSDFQLKDLFKVMGIKWKEEYEWFTRGNIFKLLLGEPTQPVFRSPVKTCDFYRLDMTEFLRKYKDVTRPLYRTKKKLAYGKDEAVAV